MDPTSVVLHSKDPLQGSTASAVPLCRSISTRSVILFTLDTSHRQAWDCSELQVKWRPTCKILSLRNTHLFCYTKMLSRPSRINTMLRDWNKLVLQKTMRRVPRPLYAILTTAKPRSFATTSLLNQHASDTEQVPYWRKVGPWKEVHADDFLTYGWQVRCINYLLPSTGLTVDTRKRTRSSVRTSYSAS